MVAIGLLKGNLVAEDYEDDVAKDPRIDALREKMVIKEDKDTQKNILKQINVQLLTELRFILMMELQQRRLRLNILLS